MTERSRYVPRAVLMEALAALTLSRETGAPVYVEPGHGLRGFWVIYDPDLNAAGMYWPKLRQIAIRWEPESAHVRATMEHELIHHVQFTTGKVGVRRAIKGETSAFDARQRDLPHAARRVEYYPNVVSDAEGALQLFQWHQRVAPAPLEACVRAQVRHRAQELPEALRAQYLRDVMTEAARRLPRVKRNPTKQLAKRLDVLLPELESLRDDADYTERVGRQAVRSLVALRRATLAAEEVAEDAQKRAEASVKRADRLAHDCARASHELQQAQARLRLLERDLGSERARRAERDVAIANLEAELASARKEQPPRVVTRTALAAQPSAEERKRRDEMMRREAKKKR
jgi:chromosome segregation ATPase